MRQYNISDYTVEIDEEATAEWYKNNEGWECPCGHCRNFFEAVKQNRLPEEAAELLSMLGIPAEKPTYVCELCPHGETHLYQFDYRIAGNILKETERKEPGRIYCGHETYPLGVLGFPEPHFDLMFYMEIPWEMMKNSK